MAFDNITYWNICLQDEHSVGESYVVKITHLSIFTILFSQCVCRCLVSVCNFPPILQFPGNGKLRGQSRESRDFPGIFFIKKPLKECQLVYESGSFTSEWLLDALFCNFHWNCFAILAAFTVKSVIIGVKSSKPIYYTQPKVKSTGCCIFYAFWKVFFN